MGEVEGSVSWRSSTPRDIPALSRSCTGSSRVGSLVLVGEGGSRWMLTLMGFSGWSGWEGWVRSCCRGC